MHRCLAVSVSLLRMWVHCPRASNGLLPRRSNLVGYVRWDARSDRFPPCQAIIPTAFRSQSGLSVTRSESAQRSDGTSEDLSGGFYFHAARSSLVQGQVIQLIGNAGCSVRDACMATPSSW